MARRFVYQGLVDSKPSFLVLDPLCELEVSGSLAGCKGSPNTWVEVWHNSLSGHPKTLVRIERHHSCATFDMIVESDDERHVRVFTPEMFLDVPPRDRFVAGDLRVVRGSWTAWITANGSVPLRVHFDLSNICWPTPPRVFQVDPKYQNGEVATTISTAVILAAAQAAESWGTAFSYWDGDAPATALLPTATAVARVALLPILGLRIYAATLAFSLVSALAAYTFYRSIRPRFKKSAVSFGVQIAAVLILLWMGA